MSGHEFPILHEKHCSFFNSVSFAQTCSCRVTELYLKRPGLQEVSIRDYFANSAMQSLISGTNIDPEKRVNALGSDWTIAELVAKMAYGYADAMLNERNKK